LLSVDRYRVSGKRCCSACLLPLEAVVKAAISCIRLIKTCREVLAPAQQAGDESTAALVSDRMRVHEKTAWMLRALQ
jgi:DNA-binding ferritin-like protein